jgi:hypothetical protein
MIRPTSGERSPQLAGVDSVGGVADDWRVTVDLHAEENVGRLRQALHEHEVEGEARERLGDRVAVGGGEDPGVIFLYATTSDAVHEAQGVVKEILHRHGLEADYSVDRWHPIEERWESEQIPLPSTEAEKAVEHKRLEEDEVAESELLGGALWEVRVELDSRQDAAAFAERLEAERDSLLPGRRTSVIRRWKYLIIGADNEDQANEIVGRIRGELPSGATVEVEPSGTLAWASMDVNPFAVFGGLGT